MGDSARSSLPSLAPDLPGCTIAQGTRTLAKSIQAVRGMNDILPEDTPRWQYLEATARQVLAAYGYTEIRLPVLEQTELFSRSIGEVTDIVEKEMYNFPDRSGMSLTLRPEGTAGCVRSVIQHGLLRGKMPRMWYIGPMFRHERPQMGRYRQFYQIGVEAFGMAGPEIDAEQILMTARLWRRLGLSDLVLELNSLGSPESRVAYRELLVDYFETHYHVLDEDSRRRLATNPLRILDSKIPEMQGLIHDAPSLLEYLDQASAEHFTRVQALLEAAGVNFRINPRLVRGLDYYTKTVFEWVTERLGAQGSVCAGGRYDGLVAQIGGPPTPAVGFAIGLERLIALLKEGASHHPEGRPHAYLLAVGEDASVQAMVLAESLRDQLVPLRLLVDAEPGGFKSKLKRADRSGARLALILGEDEAKTQQVSIKYLREEKDQQSVPQTALGGYLERTLFAVDLT